MAYRAGVRLSKHHRLTYSEACSAPGADKTQDHASCGERPAVEEEQALSPFPRDPAGACNPARVRLLATARSRHHMGWWAHSQPWPIQRLAGGRASSKPAPSATPPCRLHVAGQQPKGLAASEHLVHSELRWCRVNSCQKQSTPMQWHDDMRQSATCRQCCW